MPFRSVKDKVLNEIKRLAEIVDVTFLNEVKKLAETAAMRFLNDVMQAVKSLEIAFLTEVAEVADSVQTGEFIATVKISAAAVSLYNVIAERMSASFRSCFSLSR